MHVTKQQLSPAMAWLLNFLNLKFERIGEAGQENPPFLPEVQGGSADKEYNDAMDIMSNIKNPKHKKWKAESAKPEDQRPIHKFIENAYKKKFPSPTKKEERGVYKFLATGVPPYDMEEARSLQKNVPPNSKLLGFRGRKTAVRWSRCSLTGM